MKEGRLQDLDLKDGMTVVCVDDGGYPWWTEGKEYIVEKRHGGLSTLDDNGDLTVNTRAIFKIKGPLLRKVKIDLRREDGSTDSELSEAFQKLVFEDGGVWSNGNKEIKYTDAPFLYVYAGDNAMYFGHDFKGFQDSNHTEVKLNPTLSYSVEFIDPVPKELVELRNTIEDLQEQLNEATSSLNKLVKG